LQRGQFGGRVGAALVALVQPSNALSGTGTTLLDATISLRTRPGWVSVSRCAIIPP
jgi:hypothetical protein